jgi:low affinity Fe/Cu permease
VPRGDPALRPLTPLGVVAARPRSYATAKQWEGVEVVAGWFAHVANRVAQWSGSYRTFVGAVTIILVWAVTGPLFKFSDTWQLVINTGTTVVTFLMVFLIQNTQNRDARAVHLKL